MLDKPPVAGRNLSGIGLVEARQRIFRQGFREFDVADDWVHFKRPGTHLTLSSHRRPIDLVVAHQEDRLELVLRYDGPEALLGLALGDRPLEEEADRLSRILSQGDSS